MSLRTAVVCGGPSSEAAVSRVSAAAVRLALEEAGHKPELVELDADIVARLEGFDVAFPVAHGPMGEDGCLQGLLEVLGIPYVGSGVLASSLAADKPRAKCVFRDRGLPVAAEVLVTPAELARDGARLVRELRASLGAAVVVKPVSGGSGIGVTPVSESATDADLRAALQEAFDVDPRVLVEALRPGHEVTCSVYEPEGTALAMPPTLIRSKAAEWYDFQSRYGTGGSEHECPAPFSAALIAKIQQLAVRAHQAVGARDLSRADFVVDDASGDVTLLEVNTLPGMTATSLFPEAVGVYGVSFKDLCDVLVRRAHGRPPRFVPETRAFPD